MRKQTQAVLVLTLIISCLTFVNGQVAGNPPYTLEQSVTASGGTSNNTGNQFSLTGAIGQSIAGTTSANSPFSLQSGFFTLPLSQPTAAGVTISGRVTTADGTGIRNVRIALTEADGTTRTALSSAFGYYSFTDVVVNQMVILSAKGKRFTFVEPMKFLYLIEETNATDFIAAEQ